MINIYCGWKEEYELVFKYEMEKIKMGTIFFFNDTATTEIYTLSLHDALPILFFKIYNFRIIAYRIMIRPS